MNTNAVTVNTNVLKDHLKYNGETVLTYKIEYPEFRGSNYQMTLVLINRYYRNKAREIKKYYETTLYKMAVEQYKEDKKNGYPVRVFDAVVAFKVTYNRACIISLYQDQYQYTGGAHGNTVRTSQTWNLQKYIQIQLSQLFGCNIHYKSYILDEVKKQIRRNPDIYFEDYEKLIFKNFNDNNFYCTYAGIVFYYQQYDIAPYSSGIREFLIPYTDCVIDPRRLCFSIRT